MKLNKQYSRGFLIAASAYRRQARERFLDFSAESLHAQYEHETFGKPSPDPKVNGYTCGKWILDAIIKQMFEDHQTGLLTKYDLSKNSSAFIRRELLNWPATTFHPYYKD